MKVAPVVAATGSMLIEEPLLSLELVSFQESQEDARSSLLHTLLEKGVERVTCFPDRIGAAGSRGMAFRTTYRTDATTSLRRTLPFAEYMPPASRKWLMDDFPTETGDSS
jgi:hypothetical protein